MNKVFQPAAAIFDVDGLMLDTERPLIPLWIQAGKAFGRDIEPDLVIRTIGLNSNDIHALCIRELGDDFPHAEFWEALSRLVDIEFNKGIAHRPGLIELLDHLAALKIPLAVGTSARRNAALWKLEKAGIADRFAHIVCGDEVKNGKPAPDIFLKAAEKLGILPCCCVGFEDSPAGLQALANARIPSVFIKDIIEPPTEILSTVWRRFENLSEAIPLFN